MKIVINGFNVYPYTDKKSAQLAKFSEETIVQIAGGFILRNDLGNYWADAQGKLPNHFTLNSPADPQ